MSLVPDLGYELPQRTLGPCPTCPKGLKRTVLLKQWVMAKGKTPGRWEALPQPLEPCFGLPYVCHDGVHVTDRSWLDDYCTVLLEEAWYLSA
jgi:hypothetical protein